MIRLTLISGGLVVLVAFFAGLLTPSPVPIIGPIVTPHLQPPTLERPGWSVGAASAYFAKLNPPPPPPPPPPVPKPPVIDIADQFRHEISAVSKGRSGIRLLVIEDQGAGRQSRWLKAGDIFKSGWRISAVDHRQVTLVKGRDRRIVSLFGPQTKPPVTKS